MLFQSMTFIFIFFPLAALLYYVFPERMKTARSLVLLIFSLLFYAWGDVRGLLVLVFAILCNYYLGCDLGNKTARGKMKGARRTCRFGIGFNLVILIFFGYVEFVIGSVDRSFGWSIPNKQLGVLPGAGILFLSFAGYLLDLYRGNTGPERNILNFALYICMFPKVLYGPYIGYDSFRAQLTERKGSLEMVGEGLGRFCVGLAKTAVLAQSGEAVFRAVNSASAQGISVVTAWYGIVMWAFSVYFRFSGLSDMAIGIGGVFGFRLPENFQYPVVAKSIGEFWKRWNMSVTEWFRRNFFDILDRKSIPRAMHIRNILLVWALMGFWYGCSWTYLAGGLVFGILLVLEKYVYGRFLNRLPSVVRHIYTLILLFFVSTFFSQKTFAGVFHYIGQMFGGGHALVNGTAFYYLRTGLILLIIMITASLPFGRKWKQELTESKNNVFRILEMVMYTLLFLLSVAFIL